MLRYVRVGIIVLLVLVSAYSAMAVPQMTPTKWSQLPDMDKGKTFSSESKVPSLVADDWTCPDGQKITGIHWWGAYWAPVTNGNYGSYSDGRPNVNSVTTAVPVTSWTLKVWSNLPASSTGNSSPYAVPGAVLKTWTVQNANEQYYGTTTSGTVLRKVYDYSVDLTSDPFFQTKGVTYWLSIEATVPDTDKQWGWHESNNHQDSAAVNDFKGAGWMQIQNNQYDNDMAFELTTTPEPGSLMVLGFGLVSMSGMMVRRRRG